MFFILLPNLFGTEMAGSELIGGNFELINLEGKIVRGSDFKGKYLFVFFGFTNCPSVCPLGVSTLMAVYRKLDKKQKKVVPLFITVDPETDTPELLTQFKKRFSEGLVALRGSKSQIDATVNMYRGYYGKKSKVLIDHSPIIYFMGKDGEYLGHFTSETGINEIFNRVNKQIK